ncbi:MAG TPA: PAS domain S-box protein [Pyrinomonadaceae bacterium]
MDTDRKTSESEQQAEALQEQREWLRVTLSSIGDAVITTDTKGCVTFLNPVAESLTGWTQDEAAGVALESVFKIVNEETRRTVENPATRALRDGVIVGLANHTLLIAKDGTERAVDDSAAPIRNASGEVAGVVLVFRDITERRRAEQLVQDTLDYCENIIATLREPFVVLDQNLLVKTANRSFYETFVVSPSDTENQFIYELGNRQWDIPRLRDLLKEVLSNNHPIHDYEVEFDFETIGHRLMRLNARRVREPGNHSDLILLAIEDITERRQAQNALRRALESHEAVTSNIGEGLYTVNDQGLVTGMNPTAEKLFGWTFDELRGRKMHDVTHYKHADGTPYPAEDCCGLEVLQEGRPLINHEDVFIRKDGTFFDVVYSSSPIREGEKITGVVVVFRDNTERRQAVYALKVSEIRYRRLFEAAKDGILILDPDTRQITDANPFIAQLLGYTREEMIGKELFEIGLLKDEEASKAAFRELRENNFIRYEDLPLESKKGQRREVEVVANLYAEDGQSVIQANIRDITARKQADYNLEVSESRYRRLFETAQDAILILDANTGKIFDANPFIKELLGYSQEELVGKELWQIGFFRDKSESQAAFRKLQMQGYIRYEDLPLETKQGQRIEVEFVSNIYQVDHQQVIQCNIRDITKRSRLERQTHEQADTLAELHLRKDEFLAMLSHELRNPLSAIFNALHILRLQDTENPIQQKAKIVLERQVGQLAHLIDDLLEVSRVITGKIQLHQEGLEMGGIVERAIESARPLIDQRNHELSVSLPAEPIWLQADPTRLEQVVVNLLNNAAKYTNEGGQIWLTAQQEDGEVVLRVRDTGVGIAPELLPRIFDLFTQADRTLDRSQGGLGIGLSLVQRLVELHGGTVEARSAGLGQGSEFIVRLPALSPAGAPIPRVETAKQPKHTLRVLVVDDNRDSADMLVMLLQIFGHEAQAAYSGQTALEAAVEYQPDVVLLDIGLPDMNGHEVAEHLRQQPQTKDIRLIAITGYGQDSDRQRSKEAGFDRHLVKPVNPQELQELLATRVKQPRYRK